MNKIKFLKNNKIQLSNRNGYMITYKPYTICEIPNKFGTEIKEWFNYKGFTYLIEE